MTTPLFLDYKDGYVRMTYEGVIGMVYATHAAYEDTWYENGWRSEDSDYEGGPEDPGGSAFPTTGIPTIFLDIDVDEEAETRDAVIENPRLASYYATGPDGGGDSLITSLTVPRPTSTTSAFLFAGAFYSDGPNVEDNNLVLRDSEGYQVGFMAGMVPPGAPEIKSDGIWLLLPALDEVYYWIGLPLFGLNPIFAGLADSDTLPFLDPALLGAELSATLQAIFGSDAETADAIGAGTQAFLSTLLSPLTNIRSVLTNLERLAGLSMAQGISRDGLVGEHTSRLTNLETAKTDLEAADGALGDRIDDVEASIVPLLKTKASLASGDYIQVDLDSLQLIGGQVGVWDDDQIREIGNVVYDPVTETWLACYTGRSTTDTPHNTSIGILISTDDMATWTQHPDNPISGASGAEDPYFAKDEHGFLYRDSSGQALIFCEEKPGAVERGIALWKSAANDVDGWTLFGRVVDRGTPGDWDDKDRTSPIVFEHDGFLHLLFEGRMNVGGTYIGYGSSADEGETWTIAPWPIVVSTPGGWASSSVVSEDVVRVGGQWILTFHGSDGPSPYTVGRAATSLPPSQWSAQGITAPPGRVAGAFYELPGNPFWTEGGDIMVVGNDPSKVHVVQYDGTDFTLHLADIIKAG